MNVAKHDRIAGCSICGRAVYEQYISISYVSVSMYIIALVHQMAVYQEIYFFLIVIVFNKI